MTKKISIILMTMAGMIGLAGFMINDIVWGLYSLVLLSYVRIAQEWNQKK